MTRTIKGYDYWAGKRENRLLTIARIGPAHVHIELEGRTIMVPTDEVLEVLTEPKYKTAVEEALVGDIVQHKYVLRDTYVKIHENLWHSAVSGKDHTTNKLLALLENYNEDDWAVIDGYGH